MSADRTAVIAGALIAAEMADQHRYDGLVMSFMQQGYDQATAIERANAYVTQYPSANQQLNKFTDHLFAFICLWFVVLCAMAFVIARLMGLNSNQSFNVPTVLIITGLAGWASYYIRKWWRSL